MDDGQKNQPRGLDALLGASAMEVGGMVCDVETGLCGPVGSFDSERGPAED